MPLRLGKPELSDDRFRHAVTPDFGPDWQLRFNVQFLFPR